MEENRTWSFGYVEKELFHLPETRKAIIRRKEMLLNNSVVDENVGGGKSNLPGKPTEQKAILVADDKRLQQMENIVSAIETVYELLPNDKRMFMQLRYWTRPNVLNMTGVAMKMERDETTLRRWRKAIINSIIELSGL